MNRNRFSAVATISVPTLGIKGKRIGPKEKYVETIDPAPSTPAGEPLGEIQVEVSEEMVKRLKLGWSVEVAKNEPTPPVAPVALLATTYPKELPHWSRDIPAPVAQPLQILAPPSDGAEDKNTLTQTDSDTPIEQIWSADGLPPLSLGSFREANKGLGRPWKFINQQSFYNAAERTLALELKTQANSKDRPALSPPQLVKDESEAKPSPLQIENDLPAAPSISDLAPAALLSTSSPENLPALTQQPEKQTETPLASPQNNQDASPKIESHQRNSDTPAAQPRQISIPLSTVVEDKNAPAPAALEPLQEPLPSEAPSLFRSRSFAALIDISVACSFFVLGLLFFPDPPRVLPFVFAALYLLTKDSLGILNGQSIGKKIMRLRVVNRRHRSLAGNYKAGLIRNLSWLFAPIEFAILYVREDEVTIGKRLGDDWAETEVIAEEKALPRKSKWLP